MVTTRGDWEGVSVVCKENTLKHARSILSPPDVGGACIYIARSRVSHILNQRQPQFSWDAFYEGQNEVLQRYEERDKSEVAML